MFAKVFLLLVALACMTATMAMKVRLHFPSPSTSIFVISYTTILSFQKQPSLHLVFSNPFAKKVELDKNGKPIKKAAVKKVCRGHAEPENECLVTFSFPPFQG